MSQIPTNFKLSHFYNISQHPKPFRVVKINSFALNMHTRVFLYMGFNQSYNIHFLFFKTFFFINQYLYI